MLIVKLNELFIRLESLKVYQILLGFWLIALLFALFIQLIFVPIFLNGLYSNIGLVVPDSIGFHKEATALAEQMDEEGMGVWTIKDELNSPAQVVALFYYIFWPTPYVILPYNALLHAAAGLMIFLLLSPLFRSRVPAILGGLFFVINPIAYEWVSQIHRDGLFIVGNFAFLLGWTYIHRSAWGESLRLWAYGLCLCLVSGVCIWLTRDYWNEVIFVLCLVLLMFSAIFCITTCRRQDSCLKRKAGFLITGLFIAVYFYLFPDEEPVAMRSSAHYEFKAAQMYEHIEIPEVKPFAASVEKLDALIKQPEFQNIVETKEWSKSIIENSDIDKQAYERMLAELEEEEARLHSLSKDIKLVYAESKADLAAQHKTLMELYEKLHQVRQQLMEERADLLQQQKWISSNILPSLIEQKLQTVVIRREGTTGTIGNTNIDTDLRLNSVYAFILYAPRALQIGLFSPFPNSLKGEASSSYAALGRKMFYYISYVYYVLLAFSFILWVRACKKPEIWYISIFAILSILVFSYTYANVGTLIRLRYGFHALLLAVGFACFVELAWGFFRKYKFLK